MIKMMLIMQRQLLTKHLLMNEDKFRICMSQVKHFLLSILKLLSHIVFFIPLLVLMSMSSDVIASGMVLFLGICHSEMLWVNIYLY